MIMRSAESFGIQFIRQPLTSLARQAVNDARLIGVFLQKFNDLLKTFLTGTYIQADIGPVERGDEDGGIGKTQLIYDVFAGQFVGRSSERNDRDTGKLALQ